MPEIRWHVKTRTKIIAGLILVAAVEFIVIRYVRPDFAATRHCYFDRNNGKIKTEWVSFGRVYRQSIDETEYSTLLTKRGNQELAADWKPAASEEFGIRRLLPLQRKHGPYSRVLGDVRRFALWFQFEEHIYDLPKQRDLISQFQTLVREGTPEQIHAFVDGLK